MSKLIILTGITGSGKSTYARDILFPDCHNKGEATAIVSTDDIREELFGDASIQDNPNLVFNVAYQKLRDEIKKNKTVIFDATNLSAKDRRRVINNIPKRQNVSIESHTVLSSLTQSLSNQQQRERQTGEDVIIKHLTKFGIPSFQEGFDKIIFYNPFYKEGVLDDFVQQLDTVSQTSKWHLEDVGAHTRMVVNNIRQLDANVAAQEAALYHDIGKPYTQSVIDGSTHFYNHPNVSTYLYLYGKINGLYQISKDEMQNPDSIYYIAQLIAHHDDALRKDFNAEKYMNTFGKTFVQDLQALALADNKGAVQVEKVANMSLITFINTFSEWESVLQNPPFNITVKHDGPYILFKYNQFDSDITNFALVRQCRGSIFKQNESGDFQYVCRPFDKFFNYGEENAADIDWKTAKTTEKVDGSLMKMFYDDGQWHLATNGTINAFSAPSKDSQKTFGEIFERALGEDIQTFGKQLQPEYTYLFELTSPETQVVIPYDDGVYFLSRIHTETGKEDFTPQAFYNSQSYIDSKNKQDTDIPLHSHIKYPAVFPLSNLNDVLKATKAMSKDEEGVVVNDLHGNRIKVKSPEYLMAFHMSNNGFVTDKQIVSYIQEEQLDDFLAYCPQHKERAEALHQRIEEIAKQWEEDWKQMPQTEDKKEFALTAKEFSSRSYLFERYRTPNLSAISYLLQMRIESLMQYLNAAPIQKTEPRIEDKKAIGKNEKEEER